MYLGCGNNLVTDKPEALEVAALYWTRASSRNGATGWVKLWRVEGDAKSGLAGQAFVCAALATSVLGGLEKVQRGPGTLLGKMGERRSPVWHVIGDNGIGLQNYGSLADNPENALVHINIKPNGRQGLCRRHEEGGGMPEFFTRVEITRCSRADEDRSHK